jgi:hypothetical protein
VELASARMPTKAGAALLHLCTLYSRAQLPDMAERTCRRALQAKPPPAAAQVELARLEARAGRFGGAVKLLDDLLHGEEKEWSEVGRSV